MAELGKAAERYQVEWIAIGELEGATYNPREPMNKDELDRLGLSIRQHGFVEPIVADKRKWEKGRKRPIVVGGHQRLEACKRMELAEVPVVFSDCANLKDEQALNVRLNRLVGRWDAEKLVPILESFEAEEWHSLGFEDWEVAEFKELADINGKPQGSHETQINVPEFFQVVVEAKDEMEMKKIYEKCQGEGWTCRISTY